MRTNAEEFRKLGAKFATGSTRPRGRCVFSCRLKASASTPSVVRTILPATTRGHGSAQMITKFLYSLKPHLKSAPIEELPLHINDTAFADACVDAFVEIAETDAKI